MKQIKKMVVGAGLLLALTPVVAGCRKPTVTQTSQPTASGEKSGQTDQNDPATGAGAAIVGEDLADAPGTKAGVDGVSGDADAPHRDPSAAASAAKPPEAATPQADPTDAPQELDDQPLADQPAADVASRDSGASAAPTELAEPASRDASADSPAERIVLLTPGGPLVVDVAIMIDGDLHSTALAELVDAAYAAADTDGDGVRTWEEVADSPAFMYGQFGNLPITEDSQKDQLVSMYDRNRDGLVNREEVPRFVTRNVGRSRSFSLQSSNEFRRAGRAQSPLRRLLDADRNGAITSAEMEAAPGRLLRYDADDDQVITLADFKDDAQTTPGSMSNRRNTREPETAILVNERTNWKAATYILEELYSYRDPVRASDWPLTPDLFSILDLNGDEQLDHDEVAQLATVPPHLRLRAQFGAAGDRGNRLTALTLETVAAEVESKVKSIRTHDRRVSIELTEVEVQFFVNEDPALGNVQQVAQAQFNTLDTDANGYLDEAEVPNQLPGFNVPFNGVDADGDGMVYLEELVRFLDLRQRAYRGQVRARAADQEDALFTALDTSGDGRLHAREIAAAPAELARMDRNQDGQLKSHEIPGSMVVGMVRGSPQQDDTLFVMPTGVNTARSDELPRWFVGMDTNQDGEVGAHEFLGTADRFAQFDTNADGFLDPSELSEQPLSEQPLSEKPLSEKPVSESPVSESP